MSINRVADLNLSTLIIG